MVPELRDYFERTGIYEVEELGGTMIAVRGLYAFDEHTQRSEVASRLRIWQVANPHAGVDILD